MLMILKGLTFEEVEKWGATGEGADSKRFQRQDGSVVQLPVRGGKVYYKAPGKEEGSWLTPQDAGVVEEDPNVQTIVNRVEKNGRQDRRYYCLLVLIPLIIKW